MTAVSIRGGILAALRLPLQLLDFYFLLTGVRVQLVYLRYLARRLLILIIRKARILDCNLCFDSRFVRCNMSPRLLEKVVSYDGCTF